MRREEEIELSSESFPRFLSGKQRLVMSRWMCGRITWSGTRSHENLASPRSMSTKNGDQRRAPRTGFICGPRKPRYFHYFTWRGHFSSRSRQHFKKFNVTWHFKSVPCVIWKFWTIASYVPSIIKENKD